MVVRNSTRLVANTIVNVLCCSLSRLLCGEVERVTNLQTIFTKELIASSERNLNDSSELGQLFCSVVFNVCNTLEVG